MRMPLISSIAWLLASALQVSGIALKPVPLYGHDYVNLKDWAEHKGFQFQWQKPEPEIEVTNRWARLLFTVDSRRVEINGVLVWLSFAIAAKGGSVFVAESDLTTTLDPLLFPKKAGKGQRIKTVALCAGHGGKDPGFQVGAHQEKKYTLLLADELNKLLRAAGLNVVMLRAKDDYLSPEERPVLARKKGADLYISLHYNCAAAETNNASGVEIYCLTPVGAGPTAGKGVSARSIGNNFDSRNVLLAFQIQKAITRNLEVIDRGVRRAGFWVLRYATIPAVLIEGGFMSHPEEAKRIFDSQERRKMAQAILDGVLAYKRIIER